MNAMTGRRAHTGSGVTARNRLRAAVAAAAIAAGLGAGLVGAASAGAATSCSLTPVGTTGWTGDITNDPETGWRYGVVQTAPGSPIPATPSWFNGNDDAAGQDLTHAVSGVPSTGAVIEFDSWWRNAWIAANTPTTQSATAEVDVYYGGVKYATISTPGPNNTNQRATVIAANGATITPSYLTRAAGWDAATLTHFSLQLPGGVPATGSLTFKMTVSAANGMPADGAADGVSVNNAAVTQCVTTAADLSVTKTGPAAVRPGQAVSWNVTVTNAGPDAASTWSLTDVVPSGVTNVATTTAGCSVSGSTVTCSGTSLAAGASRTVTITGTAPNVASSTTLRNTATVSSPDDPTTANNSSTADTAVDPEIGTPVIDPVVGALAAGSLALVGFGVTRRRRAAA